jgi:hypothetical protein
VTLQRIGDRNILVVYAATLLLCTGYGLSISLAASVAVVAPTRDPNARQGAASPVRIQGIFVNFGDGSRAGRPELRDARTSHRVGVLAHVPSGVT